MTWKKEYDKFIDNCIKKLLKVCNEEDKFWSEKQLERDSQCKLYHLLAQNKQFTKIKNGSCMLHAELKFKAKDKENIYPDIAFINNEGGKETLKVIELKRNFLQERGVIEKDIKSLKKLKVGGYYIIVYEYDKNNEKEKNNLKYIKKEIYKIKNVKLYYFQDSKPQIYP